MAYIGQNADGNFTTSVSKDTFSGNGSTTAFTLSEAATTNTVDVFVENIRQEPTTAYTVDGTTLTFTAAPVTGTNNIYVVNRGPIQLSASHPAAQSLSAFSATITNDLTVDTNTLFVDSTNNFVGIGENSSLLGKLHVKTADSGGSADSGADELVLENSGDAGMTILSGTTNSGSIRFGDSDDNDNGIIIYNHGASPYMRFFVDAAERMRIDSSGNLLVSTTSDFASGTVDGIIAQGTAKPAAAFSNTADGQIVKFYQGGNLVAGISVGSSDNISFDALTGGGAGLLFWGAGGTDPYITPRAEGSDNDNVTSLGRGANRFKDLYLGGNLYLGGTGSANALNDYEEGTFTPTYLGSSSNPTVTYDSQTAGSYVKIGRQVIAKIVLRTDSVSGGSGNLHIGGLPFAASAASGTRAGTLNIGYCSNFITKSPQSGYINDNDSIVVLTTNFSTDAQSDLNGTILTTHMQTGTNDNFIMATLIYET